MDEEVEADQIVLSSTIAKAEKVRDGAERVLYELRANSMSLSEANLNALGDILSELLNAKLALIRVANKIKSLD